MPARRPPRRDGNRPARRPERRPGPRPPEDQPPPPRDEPPRQDRLNKVLAHAGIGSRRAVEELITQGRVSVDGQVVRELGTKVDPARARIEVDGQPIKPERTVYFAVHKPKGYVTTNNDPSGRPRVVDLLPDIPQRVYAVGRLDEMSTGLILLTNDGELANRLAHPKYGVEKVYRAIVAGAPGPEVLQKLTEGVWLAEGKARAKRVWVKGNQGDATVLEMVLAEGKNREVRRMLAKLGHKVMSLTRVAVGPVRLRGLRPGQFRPLTSQEIDDLHRAAEGLPVGPSRGPARGADRRAVRPGGRCPARGTEERRPVVGAPRTDRAPRSGGRRPAPGAGGPRPVGGGPRSGRAPRVPAPPPVDRDDRPPPRMIIGMSEGRRPPRSPGGPPKFGAKRRPPTGRGPGPGPRLKRRTPILKKPRRQPRSEVEGEGETES